MASRKRPSSPSFSRHVAPLVPLALALAVGAASNPGLPSTTSSAPQVSTSTPSPLLAQGRPVTWWFAFKFNSKVFPGCGGNAKPSCPFGGEPQNYKNYSQQFVYASSDSPALQQGNGCAGDTDDDPIGATFDEAYHGSFYYVIWNDQFYDDPDIQGCSESCGSPWGHSKGMVVWNDA